MAVSSSSCLSTASLTNSKSNISFDSSVSPFLRNVVFCSSILPSSHRRSMTVRSKIREIFMPALSSTMTEGKIVSWIKTKARNSQRERVLLLLNLIKPILMFETFYDGYLSAIIVGEGELVGAAIGLLAKTEAEIEEAKTNAASKSSSSAPEAVVPSPPPVMFHSSLVHQVPEGHVGAYWRGGALLNIITEPGFHLKLPFITNYEPVQVTLQTNQVKDIPCGTKGVVMISFEKIEVVNRLRKDAVYDTLLNYGVNYDNTWIYDKIHHEINQFCSAHSLQQVYIDIFDQLIVHVTPAIEIISVRVTKATKPKIPESVRRNFEQMEEERTKVLIAIEKQTIAEKEAETKKIMAISEAEKNANVSKILMQQKLTEKNSLRREADIENLMYLDRQKSLADADYYRYIRLIVVEVLRLYPQPPLLIRRTLKAETLPGGYKGEKSGHKVPKGNDIFISVYNLHRSPYFWDNPHEFKPEKFLRTKESNGIEGWAGIDRRTNYVVAEIRCGVGWTAGIS